jgi:hypothetical protein
MRRIATALVILLCAASGLALAQYGGMGQGGKGSSAAKPDFSMTASYIEACSCDMFCPCYFNTRSTHHHDGEYCRANLVLKVDKGYYKNTKLDGAKVWLANDLGSDWSTGKDAWMVVTYDSAVTAEQKTALNDILPQLYPIKFERLGTDVVPISWNVDTRDGVATAKMGNGKGEVTLERVAGDAKGQEVVIHNLKYWGAQSNTGFRMWKSKREYYEGHNKKIDYSGTNGFLITITYSGSAKAAASD